MTTTTPQEKEQSNSDKAKEITFKCKYCSRTRSLDEMRTLTRFHPPIVACQDCAKKMQ